MDSEVQDPSKSGPRKTHRKSKLGCLQCKTRKVKCDEGKPRCRNCLRHGVTCHYILPTRVARSITPLQALPPTVGDLESRTNGALIHNPTTGSDLNFLQLEVLYNYSTSTAYTLNTHLLSQEIWRLVVPQIGFTTTFVMRNILALSALHLAYCKPLQADMYITLATTQHNLALREATVAGFQDLSPETVNAQYVFSALTCLIACAKPKQTGDLLLVGKSSVADWLALFRGTRSIIMSQGETLRSGPLGPMFARGRRMLEARSKLSEQKHPALNALEDLVHDTVKDAVELEACRVAITELRKSYAATFGPDSPGPDTSDVFVWVFEISDDYLRLLMERTQPALSILAFYCPVMHRLESMWWMQGWAAHLIKFIYENVDQEHRMWIQWPLQQVGWIP